MIRGPVRNGETYALSRTTPSVPEPAARPTPEDAAEYIASIDINLLIGQGEEGRAMWLRLAADQIRRAIDAANGSPS